MRRINNNNNNLNNHIQIIKDCLNELYEEELLFEGNLSERCIGFRFAYFLQNKFDDYFVDCDYNSSTYFDEESGEWKRRSGKPIEDILKDRNIGVAVNEKRTGRFIDIIIHKRSYNKDNWSDLICFELKKWNSSNSEDEKGIRPIEKDRNNLEKLTFDYGYRYGFHLIFGEKKEETKIEIFENGRGNGLKLLFNN